MREGAEGFFPLVYDERHQARRKIMTERQARSYQSMTPEQRAAVDRIQARHATPEHRHEEDRVRKAVEAEFPPVVIEPGAEPVSEKK